MLITINNFVPYVFVIFVAFLSILNGICGIRFAEEQYYPGGYYDNQQAQYAKINAALDKLEHAPKLVPNWPDPSVEMGQVSAVALDMVGRVLVFHRGSHTWEVNTFSDRNVYQAIGEKPIPQSTILVFNETGELVDKWGQNLFHMPHGITVDNKGNVWTTDVAMHQVFKFTPDNRQKPAMVLGEKFIPGDDDFHFCKPSAVAVLNDGDFFVADGYCNTRIIKFSPDGRMILQWGKRYGESPFALRVPHALTLAGSQESQVCVADRERGRVACFASSNGTFVASYASWLVGGRLFSVAYAPPNGGRLYVVNGPGGGVRVRGYVIDFTSGRLVQTFAPEDDFHNPHDVVVSPDGSKVYVAELSPFRVYKFVDDSLRNESKTVLNLTRVKPTATVEVASEASVGGGGESGEGWEWGRGAAGGAAGALGAALLLVAALALRSARNRGRKSVTRRRWEYGHGEFKLRRLLERRRFTRVHSDDSDDEPAPMLPPQPPANA